MWEQFVMRPLGRSFSSTRYTGENYQDFPFILEMRLDSMELFQEMVKWAAESFGIGRVKNSEPYFHILYYDNKWFAEFYFKSREDLMAFKLRWA